MGISGWTARLRLIRRHSASDDYLRLKSKKSDGIFESRGALDDFVNHATDGRPKIDGYLEK
jgi:hypothetical protein